MTSPDPSLVSELTVKVANQAARYADFLKSGENDQAPVVAKQLSETRLELLGSTRDLHNIVQGPFDYVRDELAGHCNLIYLHAVYKFNLHKVVPLDGDISYQELARICKVEEDKLRRIIRFAITRRFFQEKREGYVSHTAESKVIISKPEMFDYVGTICEEMWPSAIQAVPAMIKWPGSEERKHSGSALANGSELAMFDILKDHPERAARFSRFMNMFSSAPFFRFDFLCDAYDWSNVTKMVDVGGGHGGQAIALAQKFTSLHCVVQDLAVIDTENEASERIPVELRSRVEFQGHNFFSEQPIKDADVYHFRWIFHDWSDKDCVAILRALIPALKPGAKVIISEGVIPRPGTVSRYVEGTMRVMDLVMMELNNGKERDMIQWKNLFETADERFSLEAVKKVEGSRLSYIIYNWTG
ncbi:O-methyltransferase [Pseudovirgaria hyperparasitica]|uniref:O-methyltransferase n=1 Tax=Pseudovirgaria hyperparasitica TaxID=470096 RepID=A0A6A6VVK8_9PEZI|nr:O-methyltransferase [Pseudovirgaria hyperparasitica]KAF2753754.1 O-methyltransferase [Pseudovirgaria hyperparasitica]